MIGLAALRKGAVSDGERVKVSKKPGAAKFVNRKISAGQWG
jgi:hypothetical protein